jgi:hypothetical protein
LVLVFAFAVATGLIVCCCYFAMAYKLHNRRALDGAALAPDVEKGALVALATSTTPVRSEERETPPLPWFDLDAAEDKAAVLEADSPESTKGALFPMGEATETLPLRCRKGHLLESYVSPDHCVACDNCFIRGSSGEMLWGCRECNYDLCASCALQKDVAQELTPQERDMKGESVAAAPLLPASSCSRSSCWGGSVGRAPAYSSWFFHTSDEEEEDAEHPRMERDKNFEFEEPPQSPPSSPLVLCGWPPVVQELHLAAAHAESAGVVEADWTPSSCRRRLAPEANIISPKVDEAKKLDDDGEDCAAFVELMFPANPTLAGGEARTGAAEATGLLAHSFAETPTRGEVEDDGFSV